MIIFSIIILIVAKALPGLNTHISSTHITRITSIVFLFAGALTLNILKIESIGSGIGIYSGFFQVTTISQLIEIFLFMIGGGILIAWPLSKYILSSASLALKGKGKGRAGEASPLAAPTPPILGEIITLLKNEKYSPTLAKEVGSFSPFGGGTDYSLVVLFSSLGSSLLISSYDLISIYLSIELQSFGLYVLSTLYRDSESSTSAGLKYFLLGGLSSCIILLGTGIVYSYTGTTNLESLYIINSVIDVNQQYIIQGISLGLSLIFIGFLFKIAAAPLHNWSPDVYDGTPTIVTTWLTIIPKIAILFILLELQVKLGSFGPLGGGLKTIIVNNSGYLLNLNQINEFINFIFTPAKLPSLGALGGETPQAWGDKLIALAQAYGSSGEVYPFEVNFNNNNILKTLLLISATFSLIIGSLLGLAQIRIKRLLAYSTISHIGFILLALAVNTEQSIDSFIFYIIQYTITNLNIFLVILGLTYCTLRVTNTSPSSAGVLRDDPALAPNPKGLRGQATIINRKTSISLLGEETANLSTEVNKDISFISEFKGLFFSNPLLSISLAVSLFSMAGIPPLIGFFSKQLVLYSALQNGYYFISVLAIIVSVISCSYYLQIIKLLFTPAPASPPGLNFNTESLTRVSDNIILTNTHSYLISTLTITILLFFIKPSLILNSTQLLSLSLFYI
jgi:NADH-ubiquinone oxidoreductase chain 2